MSGAGRTSRSLGRDSNLGYWLGAAADAFPDRVALIDLSRSVPREVTYAELDERMDRVANLLSDAGIGTGDRFALSVGNRFEFVEILFGGMRRGAVPVPLNFKLSEESLAYIVQDAACRAAFVETAVTERSAAVVERCGVERRWDVGGDGRRHGRGGAGWLDYERALAESSARFDPPALGAGHPAFQPYTSGSTGRPKGVVLSHEGQLWWVRCLRKYWPADPGDRALVAVPLYHKERDGRGDKAPAAGRGLRRRSARLLSGTLPAGPQRVPLHAGRRRPRRVRHGAGSHGPDRGA